jgi:hypothetical protein
MNSAPFNRIIILFCAGIFVFQSYVQLCYGIFASHGCGLYYVEAGLLESGVQVAAYMQ